MLTNNARVLVPWLERHDAVIALLGFRLPGEVDDISEPLARYDAMRAALNARLPFEPGPVEIHPLPAEIAGVGEAAVETVRKMVRDPGEIDVRAAMVDLRRVISVQRGVTLDAIEERVDVGNDWVSIAALCLPSEAEADEKVDGVVDRDGKGVTFTSPNPNLRAGAIQSVISEDGSREVRIPILFGTPYMQVIEYAGRLYLKDGYHRAYGLLSRGVTRVPMLHRTARSLAEVSADRGFIGQEHLIGPRPPLLPDFLDDDVSVTVKRRAMCKTIRLRADEFTVSM
jgi:hypothetical protein